MSYRVPVLLLVWVAVALPLKANEIVNEVVNASRLRAAIRAGNLEQIEKLLAAGVDVNNDGVPPRCGMKYAPVHDRDTGKIIGPKGIGREFDTMPWPGKFKQAKKQLNKLYLPHVKGDAADFPLWSDASPVVLCRSDVEDFKKNDNYRVTPLRVAVIHGRHEAAKLLIERGAETDNARERGPRLYELAAMCSDAAMIDILVNKGAKIPRTGRALILASERGDVELTKYLIAKGSPIDASPSPLVSLVLNDYVYLRDGKRLSDEESDEIRLELIRLYLSKGADVNFRARRAFEGQTALLAAVENVRGKLRRPLIELLLSNKAKVNCYSQTRMTPLHILVSRDKPELDLIEVFIEKGANLNATTASGQTMIAAMRFGPGVLANQPNADLGAYTPLHLALRNFVKAPSEEKVEVIKLLVAGKSDPDKLTGDGRTALHILASAGPEAEADEERRSMVAEVATCLMDGGADLKAKRSTQDDRVKRRRPSGPTALNCAVDNGMPGLAKLLIARGAVANMEGASDRVKAFVAENAAKKPSPEPAKKAAGKGGAAAKDKPAAKKEEPAAKKDAAATEPPPAKPPPAKPPAAKGARKIVVLKDGREIKASIVMQMGKQLAVKDIDGKMHQIDKRDVQEIRTP